MPENDQTRWIGIRPTNPPEPIPVTETDPITGLFVAPAPGTPDFPVTLGAEVPHVIVDSGCEGGLPVSLPRIAAHKIAAAANTYYSIIDLAEKGIGLTINVFTTNTTDKITVKLTLDGNVMFELLFGTNDLADNINRDSSGADKQQAYLHWDNVYWETSIKVEYKTSFATSISGSVFYSLLA